MGRRADIDALQNFELHLIAAKARLSCPMSTTGNAAGAEILIASSHHEEDITSGTRLVSP